MPKPILLIVDDEKATREGLQLALDERFDIYTASDLRQARQTLADEKIDLLLTDLRLGTENGMELLEEARKKRHAPISIMMTAYGSVDNAVEAMRRGAWHFVTKPLNLDEVELLLLRASKNRSTEQENHRLLNENATLRKKADQSPTGLERIIGKSHGIQEITKKIEQIAPTKATILIQGESGTGKEVAAHTIHDLSGRHPDKFLAVNCAALSPQLLESELFGHEKGAFTGATQKRLGRFEQANGGTLFLDEIGEIDPTIQVKLLRVLSERTLERVGSNSPIKIDVRLIAATNKNLLELVQKGEFREDLYYRLNVILLQMPPLRKRPTDIVLLSQAFLKEYSQENHKDHKILSEQALQEILNYPWPGNVRELRTAIEHGVIMSNGHEILPKHLPQFIGNPAQNIPLETEATSKNENNLASQDGFNLHLLEKSTIQRALEYADGNRTKAAELLGVSRRTLQRKLLQYQK